MKNIQKTIPSFQNILNQTTKQNSKRNLERRKAFFYKENQHSIKLSTSMFSYMIDHVYSQNFIGHPKIILKKKKSISIIQKKII